MSRSARLSLWQAAFVIARRDFTAIVFSKVFLLFLVGPLFFLAISAGGGLVGATAAESIDEPQIGVALPAAQNAAVAEAAAQLRPLIDLPEVKQIDPSAGADPAALLDDKDYDPTDEANALMDPGPYGAFFEGMGPVTAMLEMRDEIRKANAALAKKNRRILRGMFDAAAGGGGATVA